MGITFSDVPASNWAERFIYFLAERGIVEGVGNHRFEPDRDVSIGEFCAMAVRAANIRSVLEDEGSYNHLFRKYTNYVRDKGIHVLSEVKPSTTLSSAQIERGIQRQFAFNVAWRAVASSSCGR